MKTEIRFFSGRRISEKSLRDRLKVPQDSPTSFQEKVDDSYGFTVKRIRKRESGKENHKRIWNDRRDGNRKMEANEWIKPFNFTLPVPNSAARSSTCPIWRHYRRCYRWITSVSPIGWNSKFYKHLLYVTVDRLTLLPRPISEGTTCWKKV